MIHLRVFTHPTCTTCPQAIRLASEIAQDDPDIDFRVISLGSAQGRAVAREMQVLSVPTLFVEDIRFVGVPTREALLEAIARKKAEARG
jgi:glutaredoxin